MSENKSYKVMIVDDELPALSNMQYVLSQHPQWQLVASCHSSAQARAILNSEPIDLLLLDIEMPRMDGYELATQIRADQRLRDVPIVMITSRVGDKHRAKAIEIGVDDYLGNPYQESQLLDAIEPLLARRQGAASGSAPGLPE